MTKAEVRQAAAEEELQKSKQAKQALNNPAPMGHAGTNYKPTVRNDRVSRGNDRRGGQQRGPIMPTVYRRNKKGSLKKGGSVAPPRLQSLPKKPPTPPAATVAAPKAAAGFISGVRRGRKNGVRHREVGILVDPTAGLDRAVLLELQLGANKSVRELSWFDIEGLHAAGNLLVATMERDLKHALP